MVKIVAGDDKIPEKSSRRCVACGSTLPRQETLRLALTPEGEVIVDWRRNSGGRGASVCAKRGCLETAIKRRRLDKAFRSQVRYPEVAALLEQVRQAGMRQIASLLASARGAQSIELGTEACRRALAASKARLMVLAGDASLRVTFAEAARRAGLKSYVLGSKDDLGKMSGTAALGVLVVTDHRLARALTTALDRLDAMA